MCSYSLLSYEFLPFWQLLYLLWELQRKPRHSQVNITGLAWSVGTDTPQWMDSLVQNSLFLMQPLQYPLHYLYCIKFSLFYPALYHQCSACCRVLFWKCRTAYSKLKVKGRKAELLASKYSILEALGKVQGNYLGLRHNYINWTFLLNWLAVKLATLAFPNFRFQIDPKD